MLDEWRFSRCPVVARIEIITRAQRYREFKFLQLSRILEAKENIILNEVHYISQNLNHFCKSG